MTRHYQHREEDQHHLHGVLNSSTSLWKPTVYSYQATNGILLRRIPYKNRKGLHKKRKCEKRLWYRIFYAARRVSRRTQCQLLDSWTIVNHYAPTVISVHQRPIGCGYFRQKQRHYCYCYSYLKAAKSAICAACREKQERLCGHQRFFDIAHNRAVILYLA